MIQNNKPKKSKRKCIVIESLQSLNKKHKNTHKKRASELFINVDCSFRSRGRHDRVCKMENAKGNRKMALLVHPWWATIVDVFFFSSWSKCGRIQKSQSVCVRTRPFTSPGSSITYRGHRPNSAIVCEGESKRVIAKTLRNNLEVSQTNEFSALFQYRVFRPTLPLRYFKGH